MCGPKDVNASCTYVGTDVERERPHTQFCSVDRRARRVCVCDLKGTSSSVLAAFTWALTWNEKAPAQFRADCVAMSSSSGDDVQAQLATLFGIENVRIRKTNTTPPRVSVIDVISMISRKKHDAQWTVFFEMRLPKCHYVRNVRTSGTSECQERQNVRNVRMSGIGEIAETFVQLSKYVDNPKSGKASCGQAPCARSPPAC